MMITNATLQKGESCQSDTQVEEEGSFSSCDNRLWIFYGFQSWTSHLGYNRLWVIFSQCFTCTECHELMGNSCLSNHYFQRSARNFNQQQKQAKQPQTHTTTPEAAYCMQSLAGTVQAGRGCQGTTVTSPRLAASSSGLPWGWGAASAAPADGLPRSSCSSLLFS